MTPVALWHELRQTRLIAALWDRIQLLEDRCGLLRTQAEVLTARNDAVLAQLETSRLLHAQAIQQVDRLEVALDQLQYELRSHKQRRRKERAAMRMWITRQKTPHITVN